MLGSCWVGQLQLSLKIPHWQMFRYFVCDGQNDCPLGLCDKYIGGRFMFTTDWLAAGREWSDTLDTENGLPQHC